MRKRIGYGLWLVLACCLYFFENNTGTRIVLACSFMPLLIPALRRVLFAPDRTETAEPRAVSVRAFRFRGEEGPGDVREYVPGDPVNRIHWKLSAKRDELLVREQAAETETTENSAEAPAPSAGVNGGIHKKRLLWLSAGIAALFLLLLFLVPEANRGAQALMNRLFEESEKVNAYAYVRFPAGTGQSVTMAVAFLAVIGSALLVPVIFSGSRAPAFALAAGLAAFQVYFGLAFPAWVSVPLFALFALRMLPRPRTGKSAGITLAAVAAVSLAVFLILPGTDAATETASESVRDWLGGGARQAADTVRETGDGQTETRHVHTQSLVPGGGESLPGEEYRLVTVEEEQISMPHWINYLRIILLLLLVIVLAALPFLPVLALSVRRKKAMEKRAAFYAEDAGEAACAIFRHVVAWLEATENGAGNIPFVCWPEHLPGRLPAEYRERFGQCAEVFEEAAYSNHPISEDRRRQMLALLEETEERLLSDSDWKQRLRLKYGKCLYI